MKRAVKLAKWAIAKAIARAVVTTVVLAACVPADEAVGLGSVQFTFTASTQTKGGIATLFPSTDGYRVTFDRIVLGFKTMTVGKIGVPDTCSYRGRGGVSDAVFSPIGAAPGLVQTFNGIAPVECPDVGVIFGVPENATVVDANATSSELVELAQNGLHALVDATATPLYDDAEAPTKIQLRFNPVTTATRFGGCSDATVRGQVPTRGTRIRVGERDEATVFFAAENLFLQEVGSGTGFRVKPFLQADRIGDGDGVVTMEELDRLPLTAIPDHQNYQVPVSATSNNIAGAYASLGDFVRFLFRFTVLFRSEYGTCVGNEPGTE